jgi:hypothetical protein
VISLGVVPARTALRSGSCRRTGPHSAVRSASIIDITTSRPVWMHSSITAARVSTSCESSGSGTSIATERFALVPS